MNRVSGDLEQAQYRLSSCDSRTRPTSTKSHQAETKLRNSEAQLKHIIDLLPQQIYAIDHNNTMLLANQAYIQAHNLQQIDNYWSLNPADCPSS
jgi:PAS domain-containing protein